MRQLFFVGVLVTLCSGCHGLDRLTGLPGAKDDPSPAQIQEIDCCNPKLTIGTTLLCQTLATAPGYEIRETNGEYVRASCMPTSFLPNGK